jgi:hypothetical protein
MILFKSQNSEYFWSIWDNTLNILSCSNKWTLRAMIGWKFLSLKKLFRLWKIGDWKLLTLKLSLIKWTKIKEVLCFLMSFLIIAFNKVFNSKKMMMTLKCLTVWEKMKNSLIITKNNYLKEKNKFNSKLIFKSFNSRNQVRIK